MHSALAKLGPKEKDKAHAAELRAKDIANELRNRDTLLKAMEKRAQQAEAQATKAEAELLKCQVSFTKAIVFCYYLQQAIAESAQEIIRLQQAVAVAAGREDLLRSLLPKKLD